MMPGVMPGTCVLVISISAAACNQAVGGWWGEAVRKTLVPFLWRLSSLMVIWQYRVPAFLLCGDGPVCFR